MSRKVFTAGEVLAAADVNSFLMDQTVMSFAGTAARGSAIPSPVEGMVTYLENTNRLEVYTGSAYQGVPLGTGSIVQVINAVGTATEVSSSTTTYVDVGLSATITPRYANSTILVMANTSFLKNNTSSTNAINYRILRDATTILTVQNNFLSNSNLEMNGVVYLTHLDSPATTSATTYKAQFANAVNSAVVIANRYMAGRITLMEVLV
jgi:hypothetical protein